MENFEDLGFFYFQSFHSGSGTTVKPVLKAKYCRALYPVIRGRASGLSSQATRAAQREQGRANVKALFQMISVLRYHAGDLESNRAWLLLRP